MNSCIDQLCTCHMRGEGSTAQYKNKRNLLVVVVLLQIFIQTHQHLLIIGLWWILKSAIK